MNLVLLSVFYTFLQLMGTMCWPAAVINLWSCGVWVAGLCWRLTPVTDMKCWTWTGMFLRYTILKYHRCCIWFALISLTFRSSYDNSQLCSCSSDKTVILWDVASGQVTRKLRGHAGVSETVTLPLQFPAKISNSVSYLLLLKPGSHCAILTTIWLSETNFSLQLNSGSVRRY